MKYTFNNTEIEISDEAMVDCYRQGYDIEKIIKQAVRSMDAHGHTRKPIGNDTKATARFCLEHSHVSNDYVEFTVRVFRTPIT